MSRGKQWPIQMILNDWRTGRTASDIARIYGFSSDRAVRWRICLWRADGWEFEYRKAGAPRGKRERKCV